MAQPAVGDLLRRWRAHRGMSQLDLASAAEVSQRHLSFVETGRARPSAELLVHLGRHLTLPLRAQNELLLAAGHAPRHSGHGLGDLEMTPVRDALMLLIERHEPYPAVVIDRAYDVVAANGGAVALLAAVAPESLDGDLNLVSLTLADTGFGGACLNLPEVAATMCRRLERDRLVHPGDDRLDELWAASAVVAARRPPAEVPPDVAVPVRLATPVGELALFTVLATVGSAVDVTAEELSVELFYPIDAATAERLTLLTEPTAG
ncbi:MAG: helix-turn-helix transcriptional regulator [Acidimicrobiia bacterium]|nr:helix-turn-helix transcriptional regulator [Acidimicrobiia bacterium]